MKRVITIILFLLALTLILSSCKKQGISAKELLSSYSWKYTSGNVNGIEQILMDCEKDNYLTFNSDGTFTSNKVEIKCDPDETNYTNTWTLSGDEKTLTLTGLGSSLLEIDISKLVLTYTFGNYTLIMRYTSF